MDLAYVHFSDFIEDYKHLLISAGGLKVNLMKFEQVKVEFSDLICVMWPAR